MFDNIPLSEELLRDIIREEHVMYTVKRKPGKFEGNTSAWRARVLHEAMPSREFGHVDYGGWHGLVLGEKYGFIVRADYNGFFDVLKVGPRDEVKDEFEAMRHAYELAYP